MTREEFLDRIDEIMCGTSNAERAYLEDLYNEVVAPHWTSVEDELPPRDTFFNISNIKIEDIEKYGLKDRELDTSIGCLVVIRGGMLGLSNYNYQAKAWGIACGEEITHWMPLPQPPVVSNSEKTGNNEKGGQQ